MANLLEYLVGSGRNNGERKQFALGCGIGPLIPDPRHGKGALFALEVDEVGFTELSVKGALDKGVGEHKAPLAANRLAEAWFLNNSLGSGVARVVIWVVVALGTRIEKHHRTRTPRRTEPKLIELNRLRGVTRHYGRSGPRRHVGIGTPQFGLIGNRFEALFEHFKLGYLDVATAHFN